MYSILMSYICILPKIQYSPASTVLYMYFEVQRSLNMDWIWKLIEIYMYMYK